MSVRQWRSEYTDRFQEIIQEITILGLSRQSFFDNAAFYGGSALRITHKLNRFSEDLAFTLLKKDQKAKIRLIFHALSFQRRNELLN